MSSYFEYGRNGNADAYDSEIGNRRNVATGSSTRDRNKLDFVICASIWQTKSMMIFRRRVYARMLSPAIDDGIMYAVAYTAVRNDRLLMKLMR